MTAGPDGLIERLRADNLSTDVELLGGPRLIRAFWQRDAIDELGLLLLPVMFGGGLLLFPLDEVATTRRVRLTQHKVHPDGALELCYERS